MFPMQPQTQTEFTKARLEMQERESRYGGDNMSVVDVVKIVNEVWQGLYAKTGIAFVLDRELSDRDEDGEYFIRGRIQRPGDTIPTGCKKTLTPLITRESIREAMAYIVRVLTGEPKKQVSAVTGDYELGNKFSPGGGVLGNLIENIYRESGIRVRVLNSTDDRSLRIEAWVESSRPRQVEYIAVDAFEGFDVVREAILRCADRVKQRPMPIAAIQGPFPWDNSAPPFVPLPTATLDEQWDGLRVERMQLERDKQIMAEWYVSVQQWLQSMDNAGIPVPRSFTAKFQTSSNILPTPVPKQPDACERIISLED